MCRCRCWRSRARDEAIPRDTRRAAKLIIYSVVVFRSKKILVCIVSGCSANDFNAEVDDYQPTMCSPAREYARLVLLLICDSPSTIIGCAAYDASKKRKNGNCWKSSELLIGTMYRAKWKAKLANVDRERISWLRQWVKDSRTFC